MNQPEGIFNNGDRVIAEGYDGIERRGVIRMINNYIVTKPNDGRTDDGENVEKRINQVRPVEGGGGNTNILPGDKVHYKNDNGQWAKEKKKKGAEGTLAEVKLLQGTLASINYFVLFDGDDEPSSIPHRRIRLAGNEQPRVAQPTGLFRHGDHVQINDGELAQVMHLENYTVRDEATGQTYTRESYRVRREGEYMVSQPVFGIGRPIIPQGSRVEFTQTNSWRSVLRGTLVSNNYLVSPIGEGHWRRVPATMLTLATTEQQAAAVAARPRATAAVAEQPRATAATAAQPRVVEDALEIHRAFADLNFNKFMSIIRRETKGASNFKNKNNVLQPLLSYINSSDTTLTSEQKTRYTENFRRPTRGIIDRVNDFISDHPNVIEYTLDVIQFVLSQDRIYKDLFIETFENECIGAYSSGSKESCTKGMWERIFLSNKGTIGGLCSDEITGNASSSAAASYCKPVYLELYDTFVPDIDLERIFMDWYNQFSYDAIPEEENPLKNLSADERKQHYRDFVKKQREITQRIWNNEDFQNRLEKSIKKNRRIIETLDASVTGEGVKRRKSKKTNKRNRSKNQRNNKNGKRLKSKKQFRKK